MGALQATAYMCPEAVWWRCHRSLVSDYLKNEGWLVEHIIGITKLEVQAYTFPAKIINGELEYSEKINLLF